MLLLVVLYVSLLMPVTYLKEYGDFELLGATIASCEQVGEGMKFSGGLPIFLAGERQELYVYGMNINPNLQVGFTKEETCNTVSHAEVLLEDNTDRHVALVSFTTPDPESGFFRKTRYYICTKLEDSNWELHGDSDVGFYVHESFFTPEIMIIILLMSYCLSSLMSGLNIGLFTLDPDELELLKCAGTSREKKYAKKILPVRRSGNYLLCSILIFATLCNVVSTIITNHFVMEFIAVLLTTAITVLLCEILPQSICTRYPLCVGANTIYLTRACLLITAPISYPLGKMLDWLLGKESLLMTYNKERLKELLFLTELATDEVKIIAGTLDLSLKTVEEIMTMSNDMFKLPISSVLDFETIAKIISSGYSRIPIYVGRSSNIQHLLLTKDLALLDPEDKVPVKAMVQNVKFKCHYVSKGTTLDKLLEIFKDSRNHMVFVVEDHDLSSSHEDVGSSSEEVNVIGLVTFEDVIEEIFQIEINDETDKFSDNRIKRQFKSEHDFPKFLKKLPLNAPKPSANFKLAIFSFLSTIDEFSDLHISKRVLQALLDLDDVYCVADGQSLPQDTIYAQGVPANYFVMILEGEMEIKIGNEGLTFEAGAFRYFGLEALKLKESSSTFIPDYTLQAVKKSMYIKIKKVIYEAAVLVTQNTRFDKSPNISVSSDLYNYYQQLSE